MTDIVRVAELLYLISPAYLANMAAPFARFWKRWNRPFSERWLGSHKTVVGAVAGISVALIAAFVQSRIEWRGGIVDYDRWPLIGLLLEGCRSHRGTDGSPPINWISELARSS